MDFDSLLCMIRGLREKRGFNQHRLEPSVDNESLIQLGLEKRGFELAMDMIQVLGSSPCWFTPFLIQVLAWT